MKGIQATKVLREALYLGRETLDLLNNMDRLSFKVMMTLAENTVEAYTCNGTTHQYNSQDAACYWNVMRMLRLFFNEWIFCAFQHDLRGIILDRSKPDDPLYEDWDRLPMIAMHNGDEIMNGVLASVPFSLEFLEKPLTPSGNP